MKVNYKVLEELGLIKDQLLLMDGELGTGIEYSYFGEKELDAEGNMNIYALKYDWDAPGPEPDRLEFEKVNYKVLEELGLITDRLLFRDDNFITGIEYSYYGEKELDAEGNMNVYVLKYDCNAPDAKPVRLEGEEESERVKRMLVLVENLRRQRAQISGKNL